jgi:hypothetical protein
MVMMQECFGLLGTIISVFGFGQLTKVFAKQSGEPNYGWVSGL